MKKALFVALFAAASVAASAQKSDKKVNFGLGTLVSFPTGDLNQFQKLGTGIEAQASTNIATNLDGFAQVGVSSFGGKKVGTVEGESLTHIPIIVGARYSANNLLAGAGIGYGIWTGGGSSSNGFLYSPQVGYDFGKVQALANYTSTSVTGGNLSYFGLKMFYKF